MAEQSKRFLRGSEWRKWDLHLHPPGTHLNESYGTSDEDWQRYCQILEDSDVVVFGITDYFSLDGYFACHKRFTEQFPDSNKVLFPNIELRLNETVNGEVQEVDLHLLLRPGLDQETGNRLLAALKTEVTEPGSHRPLACGELKAKEHFEAATVTRANVKTAIETAFGDVKPWDENVLIVVAANNSGIRAASGKKRKANLADLIDHMADAVFGNDTNAQYFLDIHRTEDGSPAVAKPVFGGCDAHNFDQLAALGVEVEEPDRKTVTWIKADPTYDGLLQTLAEPAARVHLGATRPDRKEPYKVISAVRFSGTDDFPKEIVFNQNLVAVIGSRSSGKSALLAYIAHAVDGEYSERQQLKADPAASEKTIGPAPGITWADVAHIDCEIEWGEGITTGGRVIYVPQNSLFAISEKPDEITAKIEPTLYRLDPAFEVAHRQTMAEVDAANEEIRTAAGEWFRGAIALDAAEDERRDLGEKAAIEKTKADLEEQVSALRQSSSLSEGESHAYEQLVNELGRIESRRREIEAETERLAPHLATLEDGSYAAAASVTVDLRLHPPISELPEALRGSIADLIEKTEGSTRSAVEDALTSHQVDLDLERAALDNDEQRLRGENESLMKKNQANEEIEALVVEKKKQDEALAGLAAKDKEIEQSRAALEQCVETIKTAILRRAAVVDGLKSTFESKERILEGQMTFGLEQKLSEKARKSISSRVNRRATTTFVDRDSGIDLAKCQSMPAEFLREIRSGEQKVLSGQDAEEIAIDTLVASPEVRFSATMEGDRIGGFRAATMTPGKQALFALTLILNESEEAWPLLIDQPEDDLDSRSIYDVLVRYLSDRKKERQIIMVSHDANLVIGADSEQVVVANRHGDDRQNVGGQQFDYFSGSLEYSRERKASPVAFELGGIREHACDILDGGEDAFRKRKEKYKI